MTTTISHQYRIIILLYALFLMITTVGAKAQTATDRIITDTIQKAANISTITKYSALIELPKCYLSGVCTLKTENDTIIGCLFNEFGISALEFVHYPGKRKVKILNVIQMLNKWYIKRILRREIAHVLDNLRQGNEEYHNERHKISYKFTLLSDDHATE